MTGERSKISLQLLSTSAEKKPQDVQSLGRISSVAHLQIPIGLMGTHKESSSSDGIYKGLGKCKGRNYTN
jgi:hypothetical protein